MSNLVEEIHAIPPDILNGVVRCKFSSFLVALDGEDLEAITALLDSKMATVAVHRLLRQYGDFGITVVKDHRRKRCVCYTNG